MFTHTSQMKTTWLHSPHMFGTFANSTACCITPIPLNLSRVFLPSNHFTNCSGKEKAERSSVDKQRGLSKEHIKIITYSCK